jgi:hypothetical protein
LRLGFELLQRLRVNEVRIDSQRKQALTPG